MRRTYAYAVTCTGCLLAWIISGPVLAQPPLDPNLPLEALSKALAYRVMASNQRATAVLLEVKPSKGKGANEGDHDWIFATCFHAMAGASGFSLEEYQEGTVGTATIYDSKDSRKAPSPPEVYAEPLNDLVILKVRLPKAQKVPQVKYAMGLRQRDPKAPGRQGFAFGYPYYLNNTLVSKPLLFEGVGSTYGAFRKRKRTNLEFEFTGLEATAQGMSGGPIFGADGSFAGLVFGRLPDTVNLMIPARFVRKAYEKATAADGFEAFDEKKLDRGLSPFEEKDLDEFAASAREFTNEMAWDDFSHWSHVFGNLGYFRRSFQEVSIESAFFENNDGTGPEKLTVAYHDKASQGATKGFLKLWINGHKQTMERTSEINLTSYLHPGENLLIFERSVGGIDLNLGVDVGEMLSSMSIDVKFWGNRSGPTYRLKRSLPTIAKAFSVYVTIHRPWKLEPHDARLAVRLSWLEDLLRSRRLRWSPELADAKTGSSIRGSALIQPLSPKDLDAIRDLLPQDLRDTAVSPEMVFLRPPEHAAPGHPSQSLDLLTQGRLQLKSYRVNAYGIQAEGGSDAEKPVADFPAVISARLQVVAGEGQYPYLCARAIAGYTSNSGQPLELAIPLSDAFRLRLNVSPILHEGLINFLNSNFLKPTDPSGLDATRTSEFLDATGLNTLHSRDFLQVQQVYIHDGWLITTFKLLGEALGGPNQPLSTDPIHPLDAATFMDFKAVNVPPSFAELRRLFRADENDELDPVHRKLLDIKEPVRFVNVRFAIPFPKILKHSKESEEPIEITGDGESVSTSYTEELRQRVLSARRTAEIQVDSDFLASVLSALIGDDKRAGPEPAGQNPRPGKPALTLTLTDDEIHCKGEGFSYEAATLNFRRVRLEGVKISDIMADLSGRRPREIVGQISGRFEILRPRIKGRLAITPIEKGRQGVRVAYEELEGTIDGHPYVKSGTVEVSPQGELRIHPNTEPKR